MESCIIIQPLSSSPSTLEPGNNRFYYFSEELELLVHFLDAGESHPMHYHEVTVEVCYVVCGQLEIESLENGKKLVRTASAHTFIHFPPKIAHRLINIGDDQCIIVTGKTPSRINDKVQI